LSKDDVSQLKTSLGLRDIPFTVSKEANEEFRRIISERISKKYSTWADFYKLYMDKLPDTLKQEVEAVSRGEASGGIDLPNIMWQFDPNYKEPMRDTNGKVMDVIADNLFNFIGGNADLSSSTKAILSKYPIYSPESYDGRNIYFGVREHAMGAILNGLALSGFRPFGGTFLAFADYLKPAIRMSALMNLPVTYIFTHDSINIGQDGPTHQPIEQLTMLRSIPNFDVYRPADAKEIVGAWDSILKGENPNALVLSRNETSLLENTNINNVSKGAYIVRKEVSRLSGIIIATGSEVHTALLIAEQLYKNGIDLRVISMPCVSKFLQQAIQYKEELLPVGYKTVVIEAGSSLGWYRFVYNDKYLMTIDKFGKSGTKDEVLEYCDFNFDTLKKKIEKLFR
jgi:transketolase